MSLVGFGNWLRKLISPVRIDDEAAEREEYGIPDRGEVALERDRFGSFARTEGTEAAEEDLEEFKLPEDPAP